MSFKNFHRRAFFAAGLGVPGTWFAARMAKATGIPPSLKKLVAVGVMPDGAMPFKGQENANSALTVLDPVTGDVRFIAVPMPGAHSLLEVSNGYLIAGNRGKVGLVDHAFQGFRAVQAPAGWHFGGHAVLVFNRRLILMGLRPDETGTVVAEGRLVTIDLETLLVTDVGSSGGFDPHDMTVLQDGRIAVANYGNQTKRDLNSYDDMDPTIALLDPRTFKVEKSIKVPGLGSVSHIAEGRRGELAALPARLKTISDESLGSVAAELLGAGVGLTAAEMVEGKVGFPSPVLTYDLVSEKWKSHLVDPSRQRRPQSITYHAASDSWFVTYAFSEEIMQVRRGHPARLISGFDLGVSLPRGVVAVAGDPCVYVSGQYRGIVRLDVETLERVAAWNLTLGDSTHLFAV